MFTSDAIKSYFTYDKFFSIVHTFSVANVTLADFKKYTVDLAECKYLFKATDTEFGQVKEEVSKVTKMFSNCIGQPFYSMFTNNTEGATIKLNT